MMGTNSMTNLFALAVTFREVRANNSVRSFKTMIKRFADVMQETCTACALNISTQFAGDHSAEECNLH